MLQVAVGLTRSWTAAYTRGLPDTVKATRRAEIDCDLWEHQRLASFLDEAGAGTGMHILTRCVLGIASDISWRAQAGSSARQEGKIQVKDTLTKRLVFGVAVLIGLLPLLMGAAAVLDAGISGSSADGDAADSAIFGVVTMLAGAFILTGLLLTTRSPRVGLPVLAAGVIGMSLWWYWMWIIVVPVGAVVLGIAYFRARQAGWPRGTGAA